MDLIYLGKIVNTHGIKGEVRIISDFEYKEEVFKINNKLYVDNDILTIKTYRKHKNYDMVTFKEIDDINDVLKYKGSKVYIDRDNIKFPGILNQDLIGLEVYNNNTLTGKVVDIYKTNQYDLLVIDGIKRHMIPNIDQFIKKIDLKNNKIEVNYIKGLKNED